MEREPSMIDPEPVSPALAVLAAIGNVRLGDIPDTATFDAFATVRRWAAQKSGGRVTVDPGERKIQVIKAIREALGNSLAEAKSLTEGIAVELRGEEMIRFQIAVEAAGGRVVVLK